MVVDPYKGRKRHTVTERYFGSRVVSQKKKKRDKHFSGNQSVIASVRIFDTISYIYP
jgi:hypothetical protein